MDFNDTCGTANSVNNWVASETDGRFEEIVAPSGLGTTPRLDLFSAMAFNGTWQNEFNPEYSQRGTPFFKLDGSEIKVNMMRSYTKFRYAFFPTEGAQGLLAPFVE